MPKTNYNALKFCANEQKINYQLFNPCITLINKALARFSCYDR